MAFAYSPKIVTDGLVFAVDAANKKSYTSGSSTWVDLAGSNNGTLTNGPTFDSGNGGSIVLDGTDDYITMGEGGLSFPNDSANFTCEVILKLDSVSSNQVFFQQENGGGTGRSWIFLRSTNNPKYFSSYLGGSENYLTALPNPNANTIYHLHVKYESGVLHIGYNGVWYQSSTKSIDENSTGTFRIGSGKSTQSPTDGNIYCVRVYNKALTSQEISQNYNALKSRFGL